MEKIQIDNYFEAIKENNEKKDLNTMTIFGIENNEDMENNNIYKEEKIILTEEENNNNKYKNKKKENEENIMILEEEIKNEIKNNNDDIMIIEDNFDNKNYKKNNINNTKEKNKNKNNEDIEDIKSKKEQQKGKKRVRGPNKCYRIIDEFFNDKKRAKNNVELKKDNSNTINDEKINEEEEEKKNDDKIKRNKKRTKIIEMSEKFDEFLNFVNEKVNKNYYDLFIYPVISNYKEFYIEKEKQFKENKKDTIDEKANNIINISIDENLARRKKSYGLENFLEIPEIVNDFVKYIYNKNIFVTDESKIEMIEIIFIFCTWLKQYHYSSYSIEYLIKEDD